MDKVLHLLIRFKWIIYIGCLFSIPAQSKPYQNLLKPHFQAPTSSIEGIDGIYVINLDYRPETWHRLEPILYYHGIEAARFSAVSGWDFDLRTIQKYCAKHMRVGQLGCMMSHLSIYHDALERGLKVAWIMEDDMEICRNPKILTQTLQELNQLDPEWDVLYTDLDFVNKDGSFARSLALPIDKKPPFPQFPLKYYTFRKNISENLQIVRARYGTTSMIMSERGMKKILDHFTTNEDILWPLDIEFHYTPGIKQYGIINPVVTNSHFPFNRSDTCSATIKHYYEIDDENVQSMEKRNTAYQDILNNWLAFRGEKKTIITHPRN